MRRLIFSLLLLLGLGAGPVMAADNPQQVVMRTADRVLAEVSERKAELEADPSKIYPLVQTHILPHFDFHSMTRSALGRFWRTASEQQQTQVATEFQEMLVRTYASALLNYTGQAIDYPPMPSEEGASRVLVPTKVHASGGPPIPINYRLALRDDGWKVYDVVIDGISLVTNYRSSFAREIQRAGGGTKGIDKLIETLANKNRKPDA